MLETQEDGIGFKKLFIVYREGLKGFAEYSSRGLQLDGTFLKSETGGILLVACYKNGANNIRIVAVALVASETLDTWSWFVGLLKTKLKSPPLFISSDRDKGLLAACSIHFPAVHHAFRHILENFKNKKEKKLAWGLAKAKYRKEFDTAMSKMSPDDLKWLEEVGFENITLLRSPVCRYGLLTSNNVESINSRILKLRTLPVAELLLGIEEIVLLDQFHDSEKTVISSPLEFTTYARKCLKTLRKYATAENFTVEKTSETQFQVQSSVYKFQLSTQDQGSCSCGEMALNKFPCAHFAFVAKEFKLNIGLYVCQK